MEQFRSKTAKYRLSLLAMLLLFLGGGYPPMRSKQRLPVL